MYRCQYCKKVSSPGQPMYRYTKYKEARKPSFTLAYRGPTGIKLAEEKKRGRDILTEVPVCKDCHDWLSLGSSESQLLREIALKQGTPIQDTRKQVKGSAASPLPVLLPMKPVVLRFGEQK